MDIRIFETEHALAHALARRVADLVTRMPRAVLGLPTGRTPVALYDELAAMTARDGLDWRAVRTFNLDELAGLAPGAPGSYRAFMEARLFRRVGILDRHAHVLDGSAPDSAGECARFERAIADAGGIDLLILGLGVNGHIGFNEPGESLRARTHRVRLEAPTRAANARWFGGDPAKVPAEGLTMGIATVLAARSIVLAATGTEKASAVRAMLEGPITTRLPASFLQLHECVTAMLDRAAASLTSASDPAAP